MSGAKVLVIFHLLMGTPITAEVHLETCAHIQDSLRAGALIELTDEDGKTPEVVSVDCVPICEGVCA
jgi:hypothetical protein